MTCSFLSRACWWHAVPRFTHQHRSLRLCSQHASNLSRTDVSNHKASDIFKKGRAFTLERAIDTQLGLDRQLWDTGAFQFSVYPDLPKIMHLSDMLKPRQVQSPSLSSIVGWFHHYHAKSSCKVTSDPLAH